MTAPQLSVDTVSESVYKDNVAHKENTVKNNISIDGLDKEKDIESQFARVTNENEGQRFAKDSMSNKRLAQKEPIVKNIMSDENIIISRFSISKNS